MTADDPTAKNRAWWNATSDAYQRSHGALLAAAPLAWGVWRVPEAELRVLGDVAGVQPEDLETLIRALDASPRPAAVLAPSRDGGTSALLRSPWNCIEASFGPDSASVHRERAEAAGVAFVVVERLSLAIDIDTPTDIEAALANAGTLGARTRALLESLA